MVEAEAEMAVDTAWFEGAVRPDRVRALLTRDVPELASGQLSLLDCEIRHLRSAPTDGYWTATYLLTLAEVAGGPGRTVVAHGTLRPPAAPAPSRRVDDVPFGADGWRVYLPELRLELRAEDVDAGLPALALLSDPAEARSLVEGILRDSGTGRDDLRLAAVRTEVTGFKPGLRCTVICSLEYPPGADRDRPEKVVLKLHHDDTGERVHRAAQALWSSPLGRSARVSIARPLAYLPEMGMLVQGWVPGDRSLKDLLHSALVDETDATTPQLATSMREAGRGLAELHRCGVSEGRVVTWAEEFDTLRRKHQKLAAVVPRIAALGASVLERLDEAAESAPPDLPVPCHHSFRPSEVRLAEGRVGFIDFDKFCQAEPASDLASFTTKVRHAGMNKVQGDSEGAADDEPIDEETRFARMSVTDSVCKEFVTGYEELASVSTHRLALWEALELCSLTLSAAKKAMPARIDSCAFMLEHHMRVHDL